MKNCLQIAYIIALAFTTVGGDDGFVRLEIGKRVRPAFPMAVTYIVKQDGTGDYTTIQAAVDAVPTTLDDDYIIEVQDNNTYSEKVEIFKLNPVGSGFSVEIRAGDGYKPAIDGTDYGVHIRPFDGTNDLADVTIEGFEIMSCTGYGLAAEEFESGDEVLNLTVRNCVIHGTGNYAVYFNNVDGFVFENNIVYDCTSFYGVYFYYCSDSSRFANNTVYTNSSFASVNNYACDNMIIKNNIICNTSSSSGDYGFYETGGSSISEHNYFCSGYGAAEGSGSPLGFGDVEVYLDDAPPLFYNTATGSEDFHLKSQFGRWDPVAGIWVYTDTETSPCIDRGIGSPASEPSPNGNTINQGAYGGTVEASKSPATTVFVTRGAGPFGNFGDFTTICGALNAIPQTLDDDYTITTSSDGPFDEQVNILKLNPASSGYSLTIESGEGYNTIIDGYDCGIYIRPAEGTDDLANVTIDGFEINSCNTYGICAEQFESGDEVQGLTVKNCVIHGAGDRGIKFCYCPNAVFKNNIIYDTGEMGAHLDHCDNCEFVNNTVYTNSTNVASVYQSHGSGVVLKNNIICNTSDNSGDYGYSRSNGSVLSSFNYFCSAYGPGNGSADALGIGDVELDLDSESPLFHSVISGNEDFHLQSRFGRWDPIASDWDYSDSETSPCLDSGDPLDLFSNEPSPNGNRLNQGAYGNTVEASKSSAAPGCVELTKDAVPIGTYQKITTAMAFVPGTLDGDYVITVNSDSVFEEQVDIIRDNPGGSGYSLTVRAGDGYYPIIDGKNNGFRIMPATASDLQHVTIDGFEIKSTTGFGIFATNGITTSYRTEFLLIRNCIVYNTGISGEMADDMGIRLDYCDSCQLVNNTVYTNSANVASVWQYYGNGVVLKNNIICNTSSNSGDFGYSRSSGSSTTLFNYFGSAYSGSNGSADEPGLGDIEMDLGIEPPLFADTALGSEDFHLKSEFGRWDPVAGWVIDAETSPCIDAGDPADDYSTEPSPNGERINQGAYGNRTVASKSAASAGDVELTKDGSPIGTFSQINAALANIPQVLDGDYVITVNSNRTFREQVDIIKDNDFGSGYSLTIRAGDGYFPVIDGFNHGFRIKPATNTQLQYVTIDGFEVKSTTSYGIWGTTRPSTSFKSQYMTIRNCIIYDTGTSGESTDQMGVRLDYCDFCEFVNNTVYTYSDNVASVWQNYGNSVVLRNNIICNTSNSSIDYGYSRSNGSSTTSFNYFCSAYSADNGCNQALGTGDTEWDIDDNPPLFNCVLPDSEDFHLLSTGGRWDPIMADWAFDTLDSPCIDMGDTADDYSLEPLPNGGRINQGGYGNTGQASKTGLPNIAVSVEPDSWFVDIETRGDTVVSDTSNDFTVANIGASAIDIGMFCDSVEFFTLIDSLCYGCFGLWGILNDLAEPPVITDFDSLDFFTHVLRWADPDTFGPGGRNIPATGDSIETLWFRFDSPASYPVDSMIIRVMVRAREHLP